MFSKDLYCRQVKTRLAWEKVNPFQNKPWFLHVCSTSRLKTLWEKEKLLITSNFSFSHSIFHPFREIVVCQIFQFGRVLNLSFGKGLSSFVPTLNQLHYLQMFIQIWTFWIFFFKGCIGKKISLCLKIGNE